MKIKSHHRYRLRCFSGAEYEVVAPDGKGHFIPPASKVGGKLYLVGKGGILHYVGYTNCPMSIRLRGGLKARTKGYYGYAFKDIRKSLTLDVFTWTSGERKDIESVEAEVAYLCRSRYGFWPKSQTEIHFRPPLTKHRKAAIAVFEVFLRKSRKLVD